MLNKKFLVVLALFFCAHSFARMYTHSHSHNKARNQKIEFAKKQLNLGKLKSIELHPGRIFENDPETQYEFKVGLDLKCDFVSTKKTQNREKFDYFAVKGVPFTLSNELLLSRVGHVWIEMIDPESELVLGKTTCTPKDIQVFTCLSRSTYWSHTPVACHYIPITELVEALEKKTELAIQLTSDSEESAVATWVGRIE